MSHLRDVFRGHGFCCLEESGKMLAKRCSEDRALQACVPKKKTGHQFCMPLYYVLLERVEPFAILLWVAAIREMQKTV
jgi:hypothetical protein